MNCLGEVVPGDRTMKHVSDVWTSAGACLFRRLQLHDLAQVIMRLSGAAAAAWDAARVFTCASLKSRCWLPACDFVICTFIARMPDILLIHLCPIHMLCPLLEAGGFVAPAEGDQTSGVRTRNIQRRCLTTSATSSGSRTSINWYVKLRLCSEACPATGCVLKPVTLTSPPRLGRC